MTTGINIADDAIIPDGRRRQQKRPFRQGALRKAHKIRPGTLMSARPCFYSLSCFNA